MIDIHVMYNVYYTTGHLTIRENDSSGKILVDESFQGRDMGVQYEYDLDPISTSASTLWITASGDGGTYYSVRKDSSSGTELVFQGGGHATTFSPDGATLLYILIESSAGPI